LSPVKGRAFARRQWPRQSDPEAPAQRPIRWASRSHLPHPMFAPWDPAAMQGLARSALGAHHRAPAQTPPPFSESQMSEQESNPRLADSQQGDATRARRGSKEEPPLRRAEVPCGRSNHTSGLVGTMGAPVDAPRINPALGGADILSAAMHLGRLTSTQVGDGDLPPKPDPPSTLGSRNQEAIDGAEAAHGRTDHPEAA
jgi:hypothetical protein